MCDGINHNLKVIYQHGNNYEINVVRWCEDCGAIVVDVDYDLRTIPGRLMPMILPKDSYKR